MLKEKDKLDSVLVIRSAPLERIFNALKELRKEYPNAEISILVQPEVKDKVEESDLVDRVIVGKSGRITTFRYLPLIHRLRKKEYNLVAIIYYSENIMWYRNVRFFASLIKAKKRVGITVMNKFKPFSRKEEIFKSLILEPLFFVVIIMPLFLIFGIPLVFVVFFYHLKTVLYNLQRCFLNLKKRMR
ncbi:MAG: hypothetical protein QME42_02925 [bacterium]|nr:hypothetical protein [bacterium]